MVVVEGDGDKERDVRESSRKEEKCRGRRSSSRKGKRRDAVDADTNASAESRQTSGSWCVSGY